MVESIETKVSEMENNVWAVFFASTFKESQVGRSIASANRDGRCIDKKTFRKRAFDATKRLTKLIDKGTITNKAIRSEIRGISEDTGASIGHAQKIINTYLKGYCLLLAKPMSIIKELDCPLDSTTMSKRQRIKNVDMKAYEEWQRLFKKEFEIRLLKDVEYDRNRINKFFKDC